MDELITCLIKNSLFGSCIEDGNGTWEYLQHGPQM